MFQRNELRVERRRRGLSRGRWRRRGEQSMAKDKERMAEAGEMEETVGDVGKVSDGKGRERTPHTQGPGQAPARSSGRQLALIENAATRKR